MAQTALVPIAGDGSTGAPLVTGEIRGFVAFGRDGLAVSLYDDGPIVAFGTVAGLDRRVRVSTDPDDFPVALAANRRGDVAVAIHDATHGQATVLVQRAGETRFRRALRLPGGAITLAVGPAGDVVAAYPDSRTLNLRRVGRRGTVGPRHRLGPTRSNSAPEIVIDDTGRVTVAWASQRLSEGEAGPATYRLATAAPGHRFGRARIIDRTVIGTEGLNPAAIRLMARGPRRALLAWTRYEASRFVVRAADVNDGRMGSSVRMTPPAVGGRLMDVATTSAGAAMVLWSRLDRTSPPFDAPQLLANMAANTTTPLGPAEAITDPSQEMFSAAAAIDPATSRPIVTFEDGSNQGRVSIRQPLATQGD